MLELASAKLSEAQKHMAEAREQLKQYLSKARQEKVAIAWRATKKKRFNLKQLRQTLLVTLSLNLDRNPKVGQAKRKNQAALKTSGTGDQN